MTLEKRVLMLIHHRIIINNNNSILLNNFNIAVGKTIGWGLKFGTTKFKTIYISKFQNCEYENDER